MVLNTFASMNAYLFYLIAKVIVGDADAGKGKFLAALLGKKKLDPGMLFFRDSTETPILFLPSSFALTYLISSSNSPLISCPARKVRHS
jgi:hypothetical protein